MTHAPFLKQNNGVALIEFAIALPFLLLMLIGMLETANYTLQNQKLDKVANSMADFATQGNTISNADMNTFGLAVPQIMRPYNFDGTVIFTAVSRSIDNKVAGRCNTTTPCINWQYRILGTDISRIGSSGSTAILPNNYTIPDGQNILVAEAFLHYQPILAVSANILPIFKPETLYKAAVFKPRQGTLRKLGSVSIADF